jgi:hypothetical protein
MAVHESLLQENLEHSERAGGDGPLLRLLNRALIEQAALNRAFIEP